jgi:phage terminase large subunit-like protein
VICQGLTRTQATALYLEAVESGDPDALRKLCTEDLFFLLTVACKRKDMDHDWIYDRCREVEAKPDGMLDLWAREHYKSTIITFGHSIKDILSDPNTTIGIFSHTRPIAKGFLAQIKRELEMNRFLQRLFPDVLYENPQKEAPTWSLDSGLLVKRTQNPKEMTVEAWGLVDGQPTSKHFSLLLYDDVVTRESVTTPEQIKKVTDAWALSLNLGAQGGRKRYIGTRYHTNDTYRTIMDRGSAIPRLHPATIGGKMEGEPAFMSRELLAEKRRDFGPYVYACQMLQDPVADNAMGFKEEWLKFYKNVQETKGWNIYLLVDPANKKKKTNDYTVMTVIGLAPDQNYYLLDGVRDRLNLTQRTDKLFELQMKWTPTAVGYEEYGMQADVEHIEYVMEERNYRFNIKRVAGSMAKEDRIGKLVPIFEQHRFWMPERLTFISKEGKPEDFVRLLIDDEFKSFPVSVHDDILDCVARILDPMLASTFPKAKPKAPRRTASYGGENSWMG